MAKGKKTGGRVKGTPNRATIARQAEVAASGLTPLDYMLGVMRDEGNEPHARFEAAKNAAPYIHPKLAAVTHSGDADNPVVVEDVSDAELARRIVFLLTKGTKEG